MNLNKVSIIIPVYNRQELIIHTLHSVRVQTHLNFECIIIDDCSTDKTWNIVNDYIKDDHRFVLLKRQAKENGANVCRNLGISHATGDFILFLDSDDLLATYCIASRIENIQKNPNLDFIVHPIYVFDHNSKLVRSVWSSLAYEDDIKAFIKSKGWAISSTFFKSSFLKKYKFDESAMSWQDVDFHIRILLNKPHYKKYPQVSPDVYIRRSGIERISNSNLSKVRIEARLKLYLKIEHLLEKKSIKYKNSFRVYYFKYLEIAALILSHNEFIILFNLWIESTTYQGINGYLFRVYLKTQAKLRLLGFNLVNKMLYRIVRIFISKNLLYARNREVPIKASFFISETIYEKF